MSDIVLSGIRATGKLHFGNFLGAVQNFVKFQDGENTCLYFVADQHTLTTLEDPKELRANLMEMVKDYLAAGLDPDKSIIYVQSSVPEITELTLYLGMVQSLGELQNIPTFKELIRKKPDEVTHGKLTYPVLMAADILGPGATLVPVGEDQVPNVELARSVARKFNAKFGDTFVLPEMMHDMVKVPGLDGEKMGKSEGNAIDINASIEEIRKRYRRFGVTDPNRERKEDPGNPYNDCRSVYAVHEMVHPSEKDTREIANKCMKAEIGCAECKDLLVDGIAAVLEPFQDKRRDLEDKDDFVRGVLHEGGKKAREMIRPTVEEVREKMGIIIY